MQLSSTVVLAFLVLWGWELIFAQECSTTYGNTEDGTLEVLTDPYFLTGMPILFECDLYLQSLGVVMGIFSGIMEGDLIKVALYSDSGIPNLGSEPGE